MLQSLWVIVGRFMLADSRKGAFFGFEWFMFVSDVLCIVTSGRLLLWSRLILLVQDSW